MIAVVDYGMGNLRSVAKAIERVGGKPEITCDPLVVKRAEKVILPGVGAFGDAMKNLRSLGLDDAVKSSIRAGKPFLGVCLGLQLLFESSDENGPHEGLGVIAGNVVRFKGDAARADLKIPHIGWNSVEFVKSAPLFAGVPSGAYFYFVHSYFGAPRDRSVVAGETDYLCRFASAVWRDNVFACQFHPEKSQNRGLRVYENFARM